MKQQTQKEALLDQEYQKSHKAIYATSGLILFETFNKVDGKIRVYTSEGLFWESVECAV